MSLIEARVVDLAEVYLEILRSGEQIAEANLNIANHRSMLNKYRLREAGGDVRTHAALIEGRLSLAKNELETQKVARKAAVSRFKLLVGKEPANLTFPQINRPSKNDNNNWDNLAAQATLTAAKARAKAQRGFKIHNSISI